MPKIIDHDARRARIMDVTLSLIASGGFANATMREIAAATGFANGSLKPYFQSKDAIVKATWERELEKQKAFVFAAVAGKRGLDALRTLAVAAMPLTPQAQAAGRVLLSFWDVSIASPALYDRYLEHLHAWRDQIRQFLREGREDGDIRAERGDDEIADELILLNIGATVLTQVGPVTTRVEWHRRHVERLIDRLTCADG